MDTRDEMAVATVRSSVPGRIALYRFGSTVGRETHRGVV